MSRSPTLLSYDLDEVRAHIRAHEAKEAAHRAEEAAHLARLDTYYLSTAHEMLRTERPMFNPPATPDVVELAKKLRALMEKP